MSQRLSVDQLLCVGSAADLYGRENISSMTVDGLSVSAADITEGLRRLNEASVPGDLAHGKLAATANTIARAAEWTQDKLADGAAWMMARPTAQAAQATTRRWWGQLRVAVHHGYALYVRSPSGEPHLRNLTNKIRHHVE